MRQARFVHRKRIADEVYSFRFEFDQAIDFIPGQFIEINLPHEHPDERGEKRWFSISSAKDDTYIEITTKIDAKAPSSFKRTLNELSAGSQVAISDPMGDFVIPRKNNRPVIFILAGTGTSPAHSIISSMTGIDYFSFITAKQRSAMPFIDTFERKSTNAWLYETSRGDQLDAEDIYRHLPSSIWQNGLFFVAGPEQFCEEIKDGLLQQGVDNSRCFVDYFHGYKDAT